MGNIRTSEVGAAFLFSENRHDSANGARQIVLQSHCHYCNSRFRRHAPLPSTSVENHDVNLAVAVTAHLEQ